MRNLWEFRSAFSSERARQFDTLLEALQRSSLLVLCAPSGMQLKGLLLELNRCGLNRAFVGMAEEWTTADSISDLSPKPHRWAAETGYVLGEQEPMDSLQQRRLLDVLSTADVDRRPGPFVVLHNLDNGALVHRFEPGFARLMAMNALELASANVDRDELKRLLKAGAEAVQVFDGGRRRGLSEQAVQVFVERASRFSFPNNFEDIAALIGGLDFAAGAHLVGGDDLVLIDRVLPTFAILLAETARAHRGATARAVMGAFASGNGLHHLLGAGQRLDWDAIHRELQLWVGMEVQRVARASGVPEDALINRTARQLQNWRRVVPDTID